MPRTAHAVSGPIAGKIGAVSVLCKSECSGALLKEWVVCLLISSI